MEHLTKRQKEILDFIGESLKENGYAPSYEEIAAGLKLSSIATVAEHVENLEAKGYLHKLSKRARSLQLTPAWDNERFEAALLGVIAAGKPIEAVRTQETIDIPRDMAGPNVFALRVRGDSMVEDGIMDGDYVIIQQVQNPKNGEIIVALLEDHTVTLKRFYKERDHVRLQPANGKYAPMRVKNLTVQGKVRGVVRRFAMA